MTYDANGNTLSDGTNTYAWDARNRLSSANSGTASFSYDALGRRASKTLLSTTTGFLYDGPNVAQEQSGGTVTANMLSGSVDENFLRTDSTGSYSYLTDALGSTVALTDSTGTNIDQYSYSPYGMLAASGSNSNPYTYTGRESDGLGLYYYRARYYNPTTGRFLSEDPMGFAGSGTNLYAYAGDDPIDFSDPFGLRCECKPQKHIDIPQDLKSNLLVHLMFNEATTKGISADNSEKEMAAIAFSAINTSDFLMSHPRYRPRWVGASGTSLYDVVHASGAYGGIGGDRWRMVDDQNNLGLNAPYLARSVCVAKGIAAGTITDPYNGKVFGMRTAGSGSPGKGYSLLPSIPGSGNDFYTTRHPQ